MKIEAGCMAVIVNSKAGNDGIVVTVLGVVGPPGLDDFSKSDGVRWAVDREIVSDWGRKHNHVGENNLKRINGDLRKVTSWDALAGIYTPPLRHKTVAKA